VLLTTVTETDSQSHTPGAPFSEPTLYARHNLAELVWPDTPDGRYAQSLLPALINQGTLAYIDNIDAEVQVLKLGDLVFPLVIANPLARIKNSYVCSPACHYLDYARAEVQMEMAAQPLLRKALEGLIQALQTLFLPLDFEKAVYVNNWLVSTNLYPDFDAAQIKQIRDFLFPRFPGHALIFRSLNQNLNAPLISALQAAGFDSLFSRQVYLLDPTKGAYLRKNPYKEDLRLARKTGYRWREHSDLNDRDLPRLRWLYDDLYLRKYSTLNPQFNEAFLRESLHKGWLQLAALEIDGRIDGVLGFFERDGVFTTPLVGYDTSLPQKTGIYRLITVRLFQEAAQRGWILNHSSGVSRFKTLRGCEPALEYNLVYYQHLPVAQQLPWRSLAGLTHSLIVPLVQKLGL
jgi:hypothetical protein